MTADPRLTNELKAEVERVLSARDLPPRAWETITAELAAIEPGSPIGDVLEALTAVIREQRGELSWHQSELEQTNAGLLALHAEIDRQRQRTAFLDDVSRASATSLDSVEMLDEVASLVRSNGLADRTRVWTAAGDGLACPADPHRKPDVTTRRALVSHKPVQDGDHRVSVPLTAGPHVLGIFDLHRESAPFVHDDITLAKAVANRAAVGLRNANEYEREHELAERLQRAMLPALASHDELDIVARYRSATRGVHVGGDWYDAFHRPDGKVVLTVGDVTGHGLDAAVVMGKLQNVLRAYAIEGHGPAASLRLVHDLLRGEPGTLFATAVVAEVELGTGVMRWASAGHPPPLVQAPTGEVEFLDVDHGPMLGINIPYDIPEHERALSPGSSVVLYTDGLIERRSSDIDAGMERLAGAFTTCEAVRLEERTEHVLKVMLGGSDHDDDVCLLLCRWAGPERSGETAPA
ncbi:serine/threonine protein phosphatase [Prauserella sp. PE36]|uniref:PP2C family protein-serine/threonine phosphatase n=1 Tax=Prauserella sp. PE36 TaxID=1504709 RepID=UPI000DE26F2B|nr:GAF domain-containing SpoIIE family protein phosphatase [Prauserella sp. PE36]RBM10618.1 serine/threonine protein phosphatase [Prauserella sp. PE36]